MSRLRCSLSTFSAICLTSSALKAYPKNHDKFNLGHPDNQWRAQPTAALTYRRSLRFHLPLVAQIPRLAGFCRDLAKHRFPEQGHARQMADRLADWAPNPKRASSLRRVEDMKIEA